MQHHIYEHNTNNPRDQWKLFVVIPQTDPQRNHIRIDTYALVDITNSLIKKNKEKTVTKEVKDWDYEATCRFWGRFFNIRAINKRKGQLFNLSLTTDGYTCCLQLMKMNATKKSDKKEEKEDVKEKKKRNYSKMPQYTRMKFFNNMYQSMVGFDPGYKLPICIVRRNIQTGEEENFKMSYKKYHHNVGTYARINRLKQLTGLFEDVLRNLRENREIYPEMPSCKSADYETYIDYQLNIFELNCLVSKIECFLL